MHLSTKFGKEIRRKKLPGTNEFIIYVEMAHCDKSLNVFRAIAGCAVGNKSYSTEFSEVKNRAIAGCSTEPRTFTSSGWEWSQAGLGIRSFQKNLPFFAFFCVLYKRTFRSLCSFAFFIKERSVLCVLLRSL